MWNRRYSSRRANCIFRMPAQQVCHRIELFFAGFVGGDGWKLCGDAMQVEICTPTAERARRFITDAGYQRQFKRLWLRRRRWVATLRSCNASCDLHTNSRQSQAFHNRRWLTEAIQTPVPAIHLISSVWDLQNRPADRGMRPPRQVECGV